MSWAYCSRITFRLTASLVSSIHLSAKFNLKNKTLEKILSLCVPHLLKHHNFNQLLSVYPENKEGDQPKYNLSIHEMHAILHSVLARKNTNIHPKKFSRQNWQYSRLEPDRRIYYMQISRLESQVSLNMGNVPILHKAIPPGNKYLEKISDCKCAKSIPGHIPTISQHRAA